KMPEVRIEDLDENHRLAWEFHVLAPPGIAAPFPGFLSTSLTALQKIKTDKSVITLVYRFRKLCESESPNKDSEELQGGLVGVLARFESQAALKGILECMELSHTKRADSPQHTALENSALRMVSGMEGFRDADQFQRFMAGIPKDDPFFQIRQEIRARW